MKMGRKPTPESIDVPAEPIPALDAIGALNPRSVDVQVVRRRDAIVVSGPEAVKWLQGQLSQDVVDMQLGDSRWSWILNPSGKVDALLRTTRTGDDSIVLDVESGYGEAVITRLNRFKLRTKADVVATSCVVTSWLNWHSSEISTPSDAMVHRYEHNAMLRVDAIALIDGGMVVAAGANDEPHDQAVDDDTDWRIDARWPAMGRELTDATIPAETGLIDITVSFSKGCYTGQELTARLDSRGSNVPRRLRKVVVESPVVEGEQVIDERGKVIGLLTTVSGCSALAYIARSVDAGGAVQVGGRAATVY
jgi:tRNA-modifying protein YgfZ